MDTTLRRARESVDVLRWLFRLRNRLLTCCITRSSADRFDVVMVPHWDMKRGTVESFADSRSALHRHAMLAADLRAAGWSIASYTS